MNKGILTLTVALLASLFASSKSYAQTYCGGSSCEPGVVSRYTCPEYGSTGSCSFTPVTTLQCNGSGNGCIAVPVQSEADCVSLGYNDCAVRPARLMGKDGPIQAGHSNNNNLPIQKESELIFECSHRESDSVLMLSIDKGTVKVIKDGKRILLKRLSVSQFDRNLDQDEFDFDPSLRHGFVTAWKDKKGKVLFMIENYNFDTPNGFGFGALKDYNLSSCRKHDK